MEYVYPNGVRSAVVKPVIVTQAERGDGSQAHPVRIVTEYWSLDGEKLAENDPYFPEIDSASSKASSDST